MKNRVLFVVLFCSMIFLFDHPVMAESPMHTMAGILMHLNHSPSDADRKSLQQIISDNSTPAEERVLATAILNMNHKVGQDDKTKLSQIIDDTSVPANVREIAKILLNLNHKPTPDDKNKLQQLMQ
ncbi:MAG: hypothetical protein IT392_01380 [Nitrospirae bacterium]|nr:hypothetical protein [Nitrospirota bacterium]